MPERVLLAAANDGAEPEKLVHSLCGWPELAACIRGPDRQEPEQVEYNKLEQVEDNKQELERVEYKWELEQVEYKRELGRVDGKREQAESTREPEQVDDKEEPERVENKQEPPASRRLELVRELLPELVGSRIAEPGPELVVNRMSRLEQVALGRGSGVGRRPERVWGEESVAGIVDGTGQPEQPWAVGVELEAGRGTLTVEEVVEQDDVAHECAEPSMRLPRGPEQLEAGMVDGGPGLEVGCMWAELLLRTVIAEHQVVPVLELAEPGHNFAQ